MTTYRAICGHAWNDDEHWGFWFRVFGYGLVVTNMQPMFSERHGYRKPMRILGVKIEVLKP